VEEKPSKKPEFIIIDEKRAFLKGHYSKDETFQEFLEEQPPAPSKPFNDTLILRLLSFFGSILCFWFSLIQLALATVMLVLSAALFLQYEPFNKSFLRFWRMFKTFLTCFIGFVMGVFNPSLGLGMIMLYFSLKSDTLSPMISMILKRMTERM